MDPNSNPETQNNDLAPQNQDSQSPLQQTPPPSQPNSPQATTTNVSVSANNQTQKTTKKKLIFVIVSVLAIVGIAVGLYFLLINGDDEQASTFDNSTIPQEAEAVDQTEFGTANPSNIADRLAYYQETLTERYPGYTANNDEDAGLALFSEMHGIFVYVGAPNNWSFIFDEEDNSSIIDSSAPYETLKELLMADNFRESVGITFPDAFYSEDKRSFWSSGDTSGNVICQIGHNRPRGVSVDCVEPDNVYATAEDMTPFYLALHDVDRLIDIDEEIRNTEVLTIKSIEDVDRFSGYQVALGRFPDSKALAVFYRVNQGDWMYTHGGHSAPDCDLNDSDAHRAYHDWQCHGAGGVITTFEEFHNL